MASQPISVFRFILIHLGLGLLLGATVSTLNFAYYFPQASTAGDFDVLSFFLLLPEWCGEGVLMALIVGFITRWRWPRELRTWEFALAIVFADVVAVLSWQLFTLLVLREGLGIRLLRDYMGVPVNWIGGVFYHGWMMLFFGSLAAAVYSSRRWRTRMLEKLQKAELHRALSQQRFAQAELEVLQTQLEPDYLLQNLLRLEQAYETNANQADQLLDELIVYLRETLVKIRRSSESVSSSTIKGVNNEIIQPSP